MLDHNHLLLLWVEHLERLMALHFSARLRVMCKLLLIWRSTIMHNARRDALLGSVWLRFLSSFEILLRLHGRVVLCEGVRLRACHHLILLIVA